MDLEHVKVNREAVEISGDAEAVYELVADVEEAYELEPQVESALSTISGLIDMEATYEVLTVGDQESISDNQLVAFRAGVQSSMIAANGDMKAMFGIDAEATYVDVNTAYAKDIEGIKEFFKKIWAKIKAGLVKANAFFRKMFLKFINMVSFRKGTIEKLIEDVDAATSGNETLKASKYGIVRKLAAPATVVNKLSGSDITMAEAITTQMYAGSTGTFLADMIKEIKVVGNEVKTAANDVTAIDKTKMDAALGKLATALDTKTDISALEKVDASTMKKFKKSKAVSIVRATGSKIYIVGVTEKKEIETGTVSVKADKIKELKGLTSALVTASLKKAETANDDFKSIVDTAFEAYDDAEEIAVAFEDIKLSDDTTDEDKKALKAVEKTGKKLVSVTPWVAFHTSMGVYKSIGYSIGLAKAYLKDEKDDK